MSDHCCTIDQQSYPMQPASACSIAAPQDLDLASNSRHSHSSSSRRSSRRRQRQLFSSKFILLALCCCFLSSSSSTNAFSPSPSSARRGITSYTSNIFNTNANTNNNNNGSSSSSPFSNQSSSTNNNNSRQARIYRNAVAEPAAAASASAADSSRKMTDFQRRMKGLVSNKQRPGVRRRSLGMPGQRSSDKPSNIKTVITLDEYKQVLDDNEGKMVVVRFFATWCKACKAIQPPYYRMATLYPHITFLEVPVTNENANLHQGLEVPSLPYGHIYYPEAGLVEEMKISKKYFHNLVKNVRWYDQGKCKLEDYVVVPPSSSVQEDE